MQRRESVGERDDLELVNLLNDYCMSAGEDEASSADRKSSKNTIREGSPIKEAQTITEGLLEKLVLDKASEEQVKLVTNEKVRKGLEITSEATLRDSLSKHFDTLNLRHMVEDYPNLLQKTKDLEKSLDDANKENRALKAEARVRERSLQLALDGEVEDTCQDKRLRAFREKSGKSAPQLKGKLAVELEKALKELDAAKEANSDLQSEVDKLTQLTQETRDLQEKLTTAEEGLKEADAEIQKLREECKETRQHAAEAYHEVEKLEVKADESEAIAIEATRKEERAMAQVEAANLRVQQAEEKLAGWLHEHIPEIELRRLNADITDELESKNRKIQALTSELAATAERTTALRVEVKSSQSKIEVLEEELRNLATRFEEATSVLATKDKETATLIEQLSVATNDARRTNEVEEELQQMRLELADANIALKKTQERADKAEILEAQNLRLQEEHDAATRKLDALSSRLGLAEVERVLKEENAKLTSALQADLPARAAIQQAVQALSDVHEELKRRALKSVVCDGAAQTETSTCSAEAQTTEVLQATSPGEESVKSVFSPSASPMLLPDSKEYLKSPTALISRKRSSTFTASPSGRNKSQLDWYDLHNKYEKATARLQELNDALDALSAGDDVTIETPLAYEHARYKELPADRGEVALLEKDLTEQELQRIHKRLLRAVKIRRNHLAQSRVEDDILAAIQSQLGSIARSAPLVKTNNNECLVSITLEVCTFPLPSSYVVLHVAGQQYKACVARFSQESFVLKFERSQILRLEVWDNEDKPLGVAEVPITAAAGESEDVALEIDGMPGELRVGLTNAICKYGSPVRDRTSPMMWLELLAPEPVDAFTAKLVAHTVIKHANDFELLHAVPFEAFVVFRLVGEAASHIDNFMSQIIQKGLVMKCGLGLPPINVMSKEDMVADHVDLTTHEACEPKPTKQEQKPGFLFNSTGDEWSPTPGAEKGIQTDLQRPAATTLEESKALLFSVNKMLHRMQEEGLGCGDAEEDLCVAETLKAALGGIGTLYRQASDDASPPRDVRRRTKPALETTAAALLTHSRCLLRYRTWSKLLGLRSRRLRSRKIAEYLEGQMKWKQTELLQKYYSALEDNMSSADQLTLPVKTRLHRALRRESFSMPTLPLDIPLEGKSLIELSVTGVVGTQCTDLSLHCPPHVNYGKAVTVGAPLTVYIDQSKPTHLRWTVHSEPATSAYMVLDPSNLPSIQQLTTDFAFPTQCFLTVEARHTDTISRTPGQSVVFPQEEYASSLRDDETLSPTLRLDRALKREKLRERCIDLTVLRIQGDDSCMLDVDGKSFSMRAGKSVSLPFGTGYSVMRLSTHRHQGVTTAITTAGLSKPWVTRLKPGVEVTLFASVSASNETTLYQHEVHQHTAPAEVHRGTSPGSSCASPDEYDAFEEEPADRAPPEGEHAPHVSSNQSALSEESGSHSHPHPQFDRLTESVQSVSVNSGGTPRLPPKEEAHIAGPSRMVETTLHSGFRTHMGEGVGDSSQPDKEGHLSTSQGTMCSEKQENKSTLTTLEGSTLPGYALTVHALRGAERGRTYTVGISLNDLPVQNTDAAPAEGLRAIFNSTMHFTPLKSDVLKLTVTLITEQSNSERTAVIHLLPAHLPQDEFDVNIRDKKVKLTINDLTSSKKVRVSDAPSGRWANGGFITMDGRLTCVHDGILQLGSTRPRPPAVMTSPSQSSLSPDEEATSCAASPVAGEERPVLKRLGTRKERKQKVLTIRQVDSTPMSNESLLDLFGGVGMMGIKGHGRSPVEMGPVLDSPSNFNECANDEKQDTLGGSMNSIASSHSVRSNFSSPPRRAPRKMLTVSPSLAPMPKDGSLYQMYLEQVARQKAEEEEECEYSDEEEEKLPYPQCVYKAPEPPEPPTWHPYVLFPRPPVQEEEEPHATTDSSSTSSAAEVDQQHTDLALTSTTTTVTSEAQVPKSKLLITICSGKGLPESYVAISIDGRGTQYTAESAQAIWGETFAYPIAMTSQKQAIIFEVYNHAGACIGQAVLVVDLMKFPKGEVVAKVGSRLGHTDSAAGSELTVILGLDEPKLRSSERWSPPEKLVVPRLQRGDRLSYGSTVLSSEKLSTLHLSHTSISSETGQRKASVASSCISDLSSETTATVISPLTYAPSQSPTVPPTVPIAFRKSAERSPPEAALNETDIEVGDHRRRVRTATVMVRDEGCICVPSTMCCTTQTELLFPELPPPSLEMYDRSTSPPAGPSLVQTSHTTTIPRAEASAPPHTTEAGTQSVPESKSVGAMVALSAKLTKDKEAGTESKVYTDTSTGMTALEVLGMDFIEADPRVHMATKSKLKRSIGSNTDLQPAPSKDLLDQAKAQKDEAVKSADRLLSLLKSSQQGENALRQENAELKNEKALLEDRVAQTEQVAEDILRELKESRDEVEVLLQKKCVNCDRLLNDITAMDNELRACRDSLAAKEAALATVLEQMQEAEVELQVLKSSGSPLCLALKDYEVAKENMPAHSHDERGAASSEGLAAQRDFAATVLADEILRDPILRMKCERKVRDEFEVAMQKERRQFELELSTMGDMSKPAARQPALPLKYPSPPVTVRLDTPFEAFNEQEFVQNIASEVGVPAGDVEVLMVKKGSTIVTFRVFRDTREEAEELGCKLATMFADPDNALAVATRATDVDIGDSPEVELGKVRWCPEALRWLLETRGRLVADMYAVLGCLLLGGDNVARAALILERMLNMYLTEVERMHLGLPAVPCESRVTDAQLARLLVHSPAASPTRLQAAKNIESWTAWPSPDPEPDPGSARSLSVSPPWTDDSVVVSPGSTDA